MSNRRVTRSLRWAARSFAVTWVGIFLPIALCASPQGAGWIAVGLLLLALAGFLVSFRREFIGGTIMLVAGLLLLTYALIVPEEHNLAVALITGGPFIIAGLVFLITWGRSGAPYW